jgi:hypothetical protein
MHVGGEQNDPRFAVVWGEIVYAPLTPFADLSPVFLECIYARQSHGCGALENTSSVQVSKAWTPDVPMRANSTLKIWQFPNIKRTSS